MEFNKQQLAELMKTVATFKDKSATLEFSNRTYGYDELNAALREQLNVLAGDYNTYRRNKELIFELIQETVDVVLPKNIWDSLNQFVDIQTVKHGDKPYFKRRAGEVRARSFVVRGALAGVYEVFKMDNEVIDINTQAFTGAVQIALEEFLEGRIDFAELMDYINLGMEIAVYKELMAHMVALNSNTYIPEVNRVEAAGWDPIAFSSLLGITRAYDEPMVLCSEVFAQQLIPSGKLITDAQKNELQNKGYIGSFLGAKIVILPQTFYNTDNTEVAVPPGWAWILPVGKEKPVKLVFEGETLTREVENHDWSRDIHIYKKFGMAILANPGICIYRDTTVDNWPRIQGPLFDREITARDAVQHGGTAVKPTYSVMV